MAAAAAAAAAYGDSCLQDSQHFALVVLGDIVDALPLQEAAADLERGLRSWAVQPEACDLDKELKLFISRHSARPSSEVKGQKILQHRSDVLETVVLLNPSQHSASTEVTRLLSSTARHKLLLLLGQSDEDSGALLLQQGTLGPYCLFTACSQPQVLSALGGVDPKERAVLTLCCSAGQPWVSLFATKPCSNLLEVRLNPDTQHDEMEGASEMAEYLAESAFVPSPFDVLEPPASGGFLKLSRPCCYVFPGGCGDSALFAISGFTLLAGGGAERRAAFWKLARHLDRLDAVLIPHAGCDTLPGIVALLRRKLAEAEAQEGTEVDGETAVTINGSSDWLRNSVSPELGVVFFNAPEKQLEHEANFKENEISLVLDLLNRLGITPWPLFCAPSSPAEPLVLFQKLGVGRLELYVLCPARATVKGMSVGSKARTGLTTGHEGNARSNSVAVLLVWHPCCPGEKVVRVLFPGNVAQDKLLEGLERLKHLEFLQSPEGNAHVHLPKDRQHMTKVQGTSAGSRREGATGLVKSDSRTELAKASRMEKKVDGTTVFRTKVTKTVKDLGVGIKETRTGKSEAPVSNKRDVAKEVKAQREVQKDLRLRKISDSKFTAPGGDTKVLGSKLGTVKKQALEGKKQPPKGKEMVKGKVDKKSNIPKDVTSSGGLEKEPPPPSKDGSALTSPEDLTKDFHELVDDKVSGNFACKDKFGVLIPSPQADEEMVVISKSTDLGMPLVSPDEGITTTDVENNLEPSPFEDESQSSNKLLHSKDDGGELEEGKDCKRHPEVVKSTTETECVYSSHVAQSVLLHTVASTCTPTNDSKGEASCRGPDGVAVFPFGVHGEPATLSFIHNEIMPGYSETEPTNSDDEMTEDYMQGTARRCGRGDGSLAPQGPIKFCADSDFGASPAAARFTPFIEKPPPSDFAIALDTIPTEYLSNVDMGTPGSYVFGNVGLRSIGEAEERESPTSTPSSAGNTPYVQSPILEVAGYALGNVPSAVISTATDVGCMVPSVKMLFPQAMAAELVKLNIEASPSSNSPMSPNHSNEAIYKCDVSRYKEKQEGYGDIASGVFLSTENEEQQCFPGPLEASLKHPHGTSQHASARDESKMSVSAASLSDHSATSIDEVGLLAPASTSTTSLGTSSYLEHLTATPTTGDEVSPSLHAEVGSPHSTEVDDSLSVSIEQGPGQMTDAEGLARDAGEPRPMSISPPEVSPRPSAIMDASAQSTMPLFTSNGPTEVDFSPVDGGSSSGAPPAVASGFFVIQESMVVPASPNEGWDSECHEAILNEDEDSSHDADICLVAACPFQHDNTEGLPAPEDLSDDSLRSQERLGTAPVKVSDDTLSESVPSHSDSDIPPCTDDCSSVTADALLDSDEEVKAGDKSVEEKERCNMHDFPGDGEECGISVQASFCSPPLDPSPLPPDADVCMTNPDARKDAKGKASRTLGKTGSAGVQKPDKARGTSGVPGKSSGAINAGKTLSKAAKGVRDGKLSKMDEKVGVGLGAKGKRPASPLPIPVYVDLAYIPSHCSARAVNGDFFHYVRAAYYVVSGDDAENEEPSRAVLDALLDAKAQWDNDMQVTLIPTHDTEAMREWYQERHGRLQEQSVMVLASSSTVVMQEEAFPACKIEF